MTPQEKADELVWNHYSMIEHTLNDEYTYFDWQIAATLSTMVVNEILEHLRLDDEYTQTCGNANSKWIQYYYDVAVHIKAKYVDKIIE
jgi:hypothetical protein